MPNSLTSFRLVDTATMCFATAPSPSSAFSHVRTVRALSMVSAVVKVLDTTTAMVVSGFSPFRARATSTGSTLARNRRVRPLDLSADGWSVRRAVCTKSGPRKEPPMPMATTLSMVFPVAPFHSPLRTRSEKSLILSSTSHTSGTTFLPSASTSASRGARSAQCSTDRSSVVLMCTPPNILSILPRMSTLSARSTRSLMVSAVTRWREKSAMIVPCSLLCSWYSRSERAASCSRSRRCVFSISATCACSAFHSAELSTPVASSAATFSGGGAMAVLLMISLLPRLADALERA
mmetsp:Transcript_5888/g.16804  ORF Transcript_5888/g.16804 Transcript_5888/m.16804 type:complete len:292 (-) Transcript_5888:193-1068(-)